MKAIALYAALDLHSSHSVLGSMDHEGNNQGQVRFATEAKSLRGQVQALRKKGRALYLTLEAGALSRWATAWASRKTATWARARLATDSRFVLVPFWRRIYH